VSASALGSLVFKEGSNLFKNYVIDLFKDNQDKERFVLSGTLLWNVWWFYLTVVFWISGHLFVHAIGLILTFLLFFFKHTSIRHNLLQKNHYALFILIISLLVSTLVNYKEVNQKQLLQLAFFILSASLYALTSLRSLKIFQSQEKTIRKFLYLWSMISIIKFLFFVSSKHGSLPGLDSRHQDVFGNPAVSAYCYGTFGLFSLFFLRVKIEKIGFVILVFCMMFITKSRFPTLIYTLMVLVYFFKPLLLSLIKKNKLTVGFFFCCGLVLLILPYDRILKGNENLRYEIYVSSIQMLKEKPVFGFGYRNSNIRSYEIRKKEFPKTSMIFENLHNSYFQLFVDGGIISGISFLFFIFYFFGESRDLSIVWPFTFFCLVGLLDSLIILRAVFLLFFVILAISHQKESNVK
jgi:O-antigen ligase